MPAAHLVPELALARVVTGGGPYRPGDEISLAFITPAVSRLVAHDAELRAKCATLERALVPETIGVVITHAATPYASGQVLTLSFVDPRLARVHESPERQERDIVPKPPADLVPLDRSDGFPVERDARPPSETNGRATVSVETRTAERQSDEPTPGPTPARTPADESRSAPLPSLEHPTAETRSLERITEETPAAESHIAATESGSERPLSASDRGVTYSFGGAAPSAQIHAGERMTLADDAILRHYAERDPDDREAAKLDASIYDGISTKDRNEILLADADVPCAPSPRMHVPRNARVTIRLEWKSDRLRRFVQVVDKLFTIDRLGWYRHSLAMRLLIADEIACDDMLASIEAMRHLRALRAAAVESLGKPLLAACMPGFSISSEWLATLESSREARAIAGLREALLPYTGDDEESIETPSGEARETVGTIPRRELLPEGATSVEAFLPVLIPTTAHDAALGLRLTEYRRLLVELFAQTARAGEPVRLHQMAQPNHSLDDRLWQLVGAAAEAFGGFAHA